MDIVVRPRRGARDEGYRNIQFLDTLGRTVEPELQGLPRRVRLFSCGSKTFSQKVEVGRQVRNLRRRGGTLNATLS
jgi:hypothetical protein